MKKIFKLITPLAATLVLLTACSSEKTKVYVNEDSNGTKTENTVYYSGDKANKAVSVATFTDVGTNPDLMADSLRKSIEKNIGDIDGYTNTVEVKDGKVIYTVEVDYNKLDFNKLKEKTGNSASSLDEYRKLSNLEKTMTDIGFKEKK